MSRSSDAAEGTELLSISESSIYYELFPSAAHDTYLEFADVIRTENKDNFLLHPFPNFKLSELRRGCLSLRRVVKVRLRVR